MKKQKLIELKAELDAIIADLPEIQYLGELPYQVERLKKVTDDMSVLIHGSGTGKPTISSVCGVIDITDELDKP